VESRPIKETIEVAVEMTNTRLDAGIGSASVGWRPPVVAMTATRLKTNNAMDRARITPKIQATPR
jgi:hypothetical protein